MSPLAFFAQVLHAPALLVPAAAAAPTPTPYPGYSGNPDLITPGVWGFIAILVVAIATIFLLIDMTRRIRRSRYREEVRLKLEEEQAAADAAAAKAAAKGSGKRVNP